MNDDVFDPEEDPRFELIAERDDDGEFPGGDRLVRLGRIGADYWLFDDRDGQWSNVGPFASDGQAAAAHALELADAVDEEE